MKIDTTPLESYLQQAKALQENARAKYAEFRNDPYLTPQGRIVKTNEVKAQTGEALLKLKEQYMGKLKEIRSTEYTKAITEGFIESSSGKAATAAAMSKIQPVLATLDPSKQVNWLLEMSDFARLTDDRAMTTAIRLIADKRGGGVYEAISKSDAGFASAVDAYKEQTAGLPDPEKDSLGIAGAFINPSTN